MSGLRTTLNGAVHSLLFAGGVFLYELLLTGPNASAVRQPHAEAGLQAVCNFLDAMSSFRPAAKTALASFRKSLSTRRNEQSTTTSGASQLASPRHQDLLYPHSLHTSGTDFTFSSVQVPLQQADSLECTGQEWYTSAALLQNQEDWLALLDFTGYP